MVSSEFESTSQENYLSASEAPQTVAVAVAVAVAVVWLRASGIDLSLERLSPPFVFLFALALELAVLPVAPFPPQHTPVITTRIAITLRTNGLLSCQASVNLAPM